MTLLEKRDLNFRGWDCLYDQKIVFLTVFSFRAYSSVVEQAIAARQVFGSIPNAP